MRNYTYTYAPDLYSFVSFEILVLHSNKVNCYDYIILSNKITHGLKEINLLNKNQEMKWKKKRR